MRGTVGVEDHEAGLRGRLIRWPVKQSGRVPPSARIWAGSRSGANWPGCQALDEAMRHYPARSNPSSAREAEGFSKGQFCPRLELPER